MKKRTITIFLLPFVFLAVAACSSNDDDDLCVPTEHGIHFYAFNREGVNEFGQVIKNITLSNYQTGILYDNIEMKGVPYYVPLLPLGTFNITAFANLSDTVQYAIPLNTIQLKASQNGYYAPGGDLFFGSKTFISDPKKWGKETQRDSLFLNRIVGKVRVIINNIPLPDQNYLGEIVVSGTAIGVDSLAYPITQPVNIYNSAKIINRKLVVDAICFSSIETLTVATTLRNLLDSTRDIQLTRTVNELVTPNKLIIIEYDYHTSNTIVEMDITIVDWDNNSKIVEDEAN